MRFQIGVIFIFAIVLGVSMNNLNNTLEPAIRSLNSGKIHHTLTEAHRMFKSARHLSDSIPMEKVMNHWEKTNNIISESHIPWEELPHWRALATKSFRITTNMLKEHPEWAEDLKKSTTNLRSATVPLAEESKEWRKSLKASSAAYAKTLMNMYKEYLHDIEN